MQNSEFYKNQETIIFFERTQAELKEFKKGINKPKVDNVIDISDAVQNEAERLEKINPERLKMEKLLNALAELKKKEEYDKKVADATKKVYADNYRKPPDAYKFKPGQSGNPKGRPKGIVIFTPLDALYKAFYKEVEVTLPNGKKGKRSYLEIFMERFVADAVTKDGQARRILLKLPGFMTHNFMSPLINEAIKNIHNEVDSDKVEDAQRILRNEIMKRLEDMREDEAS